MIVRVPLSRAEIGELLDALADMRDPYGASAGALEDKLYDARRRLDDAEKSTTEVHDERAS